MKTIFRYEIPKSAAGTIHTFSIPKSAWELDVLNKNDLAQLYLLVDTDREVEQRNFVMYGTGQPIPDAILDQLLYMGSVVSKDDEFVGHVFEILPEEELNEN